VRAVYKSVEDSVLHPIKAGLAPASPEALEHLREASSGIIRLADGQPVLIDDTKEFLLADVLRRVGEPVVVFCHHRLELEAAIRACDRARTSSSELSGWRSDLLAWREGATQALVAEAAHVRPGDDLGRASLAVFFSPSTTLGEHDRLMSVVRATGSSPVVIIHLVARGTVDEIAVETLARRADPVRAILDGVA
jgi:hypothetical protein